jgi:ABC-2 type transport system permease protein
LSAVGVSTAGATALVKRDFLVFTSYRGRLLLKFATGFVSVALFYYISRLVSVNQFESSDAYFAFAVVGIAIMQVVGSTLTLPLRVRQELVAGTFERIVLSPFGAVGSVASMMIFATALELLTAASVIAFASIFFGMSLHWATVPLAVPVAVLAALAFVPFALIVCAAMMVFKQAASLSTFIMTGLTFVGGFLFPVALLPGWIQWASEIQPFTPAVELLRHFLVNLPMTQSVASAVIKLVLFAAVLLPVGLWALRISLLQAQQKGTVTEY